MEQRPPSAPKLAWEKEVEEGPRTASAQQIGELEQLQPLQEAAGMDQTREQQPARGLFRRTAQMLCKFIRRIREEETSTMGPGVREYSDIFKSKTSAALLDLLLENGVSSPKQVPAMVRYIYQWLVSNEFPERNVYRALLDLTEEYPADVVITLLRVAPLCDRAAGSMWRAIMCSLRAAEPAMLTLLDVLGSWPEHSTRTSDGDNTHVFALAATVVMWKILQVPCCPRAVTVYFPRLFVHLLFQVFFSTSDMPDEVDTFWKECQQQHGLATNPNSFAVQTLKALLCQLHYEDVVAAMQLKGGWERLLCVDTQHYAVRLLAREMSHVSIPLCSWIARPLLRRLSRREPRWDLPALAFLVEILDCLDLRKCGNTVLKIVSRHLWSECKERRRLALRALLHFADDPSMTEKMWHLTERLIELLWDTDGGMVLMTLMVLGYTIVDKVMLIASPVALQLAEVLLPLFDNYNSMVRLLSMVLFRALVTSRVQKEKKALKAQVCQSLLPLFLHCHDEKQSVAAASREALLSAAEFLKSRHLEQLVKNKQLWKFSECLLAEHRSRAAEHRSRAAAHLRQALPYVHSPQEPLREAAIRFIGIVGRSFRAQQEELQLIFKALEDAAEDISLTVRSLALQTSHILHVVARTRTSIFQKRQDQLPRAWQTWPRLRGRGWLCCWSSVES